MSQDRPPLASGSLDRDAATRMSDERLAAAWREAGARVLRLRGPEVLVEVAGEDADGAVRTAAEDAAWTGRAGAGGAEGGRIRLVLEATRGDAPPAFETGRPGACYLGRLRGAPVFALTADAAGVAAGDDAEALSEPGSSAQWRHFFEIGIDLDVDERELVTVAAALLRWHESSDFSPRDGEPTTAVQGGWARLDEHGGEHFPRTDPAVIVLVEHGDRVLLGSNALWQTGRFSLLAGFVEAGESLEQTVEREVLEESGVRVADIRYVTSQPWPFPRSLMLGFRARLAEGQDPEALAPDASEISELRWFTRDELRNPGPGLTLPGGVSVARWLIDQWIAEDAGADDGDDGADGGGSPR